MNAIDFLIKDHRYQEDLLAQLKKSRSQNMEDRLKIFAEFREELIKHVNIEEEIFYPRLKKIPQFEHKVLEALEEHNLCMQLLQELDCNTIDDKVWEAKLSVLSELTRHHVKEEEEDLFGLVKELASEEYLQEMGDQMHFHKQETDPEKVLYPDK